MRIWNELVAAWGDIFPLPLTVVVMLLAALIAGLLWYFWPIKRRARQADRTVRAITNDEVEFDEVATGEDELPDVEAAVFTSLADRFAAEGRYAEAVRERLRAMVRELVDRGVISSRPGWTVTELADASRSAPVTAAASIFSLIWYGKRPALSEHDAQMRALAEELRHEMSRR